jgi:hypothetical protein
VFSLIIFGLSLLLAKRRAVGGVLRTPTTLVHFLPDPNVETLIFILTSVLEILID